jgi:methyl-accepting chemotaxis protein
MQQEVTLTTKQIRQMIQNVLTNNKNSTEVMQEVVKLLAPVNASVLDSGAECPDLGGPISAGVCLHLLFSQF